MSYNKENAMSGAALEILCLAEAGRVGSLDCESAIGYHLSFLLEPMKAGYAYALFLDKRNRLVTTVQLKCAGVMASSTVTEIIADTLKDKRIVSFLIAHNHYGNPTIPSLADLATTKLLQRKYGGSSVRFLGHYIVSDLDYTVITDKGQTKHIYQSTK